jgi:hypothetical protein
LNQTLTGVINQHKNIGPPGKHPNSQIGRPRNNVYVNPSYKPPIKPQPQVRQASSNTLKTPSSRPIPLTIPSTRDVVIGGVAFESSGRSLVRKDCMYSIQYLDAPGGSSSVRDHAQNITVALSKPKQALSRPPMQNNSFAGSKAAALVQSSRPFKPRNPRRGRPGNRNMTLSNSVRPPGCVTLCPMMIMISHVIVEAGDAGSMSISLARALLLQVCIHHHPITVR